MKIERLHFQFTEYLKQAFKLENHHRE